MPLMSKPLTAAEADAGLIQCLPPDWTGIKGAGWRKCLCLFLCLETFVISKASVWFDLRTDQTMPERQLSPAFSSPGETLLGDYWGAACFALLVYSPSLGLIKRPYFFRVTQEKEAEDIMDIMDIMR